MGRFIDGLIQENRPGHKPFAGRVKIKRGRGNPRPLLLALSFWLYAPYAFSISSALRFFFSTFPTLVLGSSFLNSIMVGSL